MATVGEEEKSETLFSSDIYVNIPNLCREFQSQFHWHVLDLDINHVYIKPRTPRLNRKVERFHLIDDHEFYQILEYKGDVDLKKKLKIWKIIIISNVHMELTTEKLPMNL